MLDIFVHYISWLHLGLWKKKVCGRRKKGRIERNWQNIPKNCLALSLEFYTLKWNVAVTNFHTHPQKEETQNFDASQKWTKSKRKKRKKKKNEKNKEMRDNKKSERVCLMKNKKKIWKKHLYLKLL